MDNLCATAQPLPLHWEEWGNPAGPPVLLVHGLTGRGALWAPVACRLAGRGFRVLAPDLRGHGASPRAQDYRLEAYAADLLALLDRLGIRRAAVVGHSLGGAVAWTLAAVHPERVARLVIEDQHPEADPGAAQRQEEWAGGWAWRFTTYEDGIAYLRRQGRSLAWWAPSLIPLAEGGWGWAFDRAMVPATAAHLYARPQWDVLARIQAPTLLIRGGASPHLNADVAQRMAATIPHCRLLTLPGADHWVHRRPEPYVAAVAPFLTGAAPGAGREG